MKVLKKIWMGVLALLPMSAFGVAPLVIAGAAVGVGIIGVSIWRTAAPVDMKSALDFFSSCWTCQIFSDVMISMSNLLPKVYSSLGHVIIPMTVTLLAIFIAWNFLNGTLNNKIDNVSKIIGNFGTHIFRLSVLVILLALPLPRLITDVLIEPAMVIGTSFDYVVSDNDKFSECMVATAIADPVSVSADASAYGAFSPKLRHQLACEVANIHQITGLGMSIGWTMMNMAFNTDYMHKILASIPIFPNVPMLFIGLLILVLYFFALLPIPLFFLEIFITLSLDLVMLPLMLMSWVFDDENFEIFPKGGKTIRKMVDDVIKAVVGIALTIVFLTFSIMFLNAAFGNWNGASALQQAIENNNSKILLDAMVFNNDSLVTVILMGIFIAMFMTMIPQLTSMLFKIQISDKYYQTAKKDLDILWLGFNKLVLGRKAKPLFGQNGNSQNYSGGSGATGDSNSQSGSGYTRLKYIESTGAQYINVGFKPDGNTSIEFQVKMTGTTECFLFGVRDMPGSFSVQMFPGGSYTSIHVEHGSFNNDVDTGHSLQNEIITVEMTHLVTRLRDESGAMFFELPNPREAFSRFYYPLYLLALDDYGSSGRSIALCRIYRCFIFDNNVVVRDLVPVIDSSGNACLYDLIEHKFYYSEGGSSFLAGPTLY